MRLRTGDTAGTSVPTPDGETPAEVSAASSPAGGRTWLGDTLRLRLLVFVAGVAALSLEMCAPRLLGPYFGTSLVVWANIIGFFLIYLAVGYYLGGRVADRYPSPALLGTLTVVAAAATALIPIISGPILDWSVSGLDTDNASIFFSSMLAVILLFAVPVILLGFVSPFAVRLSVKRLGTTGSKAGSLYALSTAGSILGAFLPVLVLIPWEGVRWTLFATALALLLASLLLLPLRLRGVSGGAGLLSALLLIPLLAPQIMGPLKSEPGLIYDKESLYNYIQVVRASDGTMELVLNEGHAIHSIYNPHQVLTGWYWDYYLAAPYFNPAPEAGQVHRVAIIGLAGGTIARQYTAVYGPVPIDGVEIDPSIVAAGRKYFDMTEPNLHVYVADGRTFMRVTHHTYDVVAIDAFQQPYIPFQLTTKEFFQEIRAHLSPNGVVVLNTGHTTHDYRLVQAFVNTLSTVFPSVYTFNVPNTFNTEVMATMRPTSLQTLVSNLHSVPPDSLMSTVADEVLPVATVAHAQRGGIVFTDDQAPIEQITDQLLLNYIQQGS
ncbi:MAG TPA: fused MFS/spermidine synthase [Ktedonobacterales bacterium]